MRVVLLGFALALALPAAAIYKWVDENGVTQYTESPPPPGRAATKIEPSTTGPSGSKGAATEDWKQKELDRRREKIERDAADAQAKRASDRDAAMRQGRCRDAREQLENLEKARPIYRLNDRGEREYLADEDRPRQIEAWKAQAEKFCSTP